LFWSSRAHPSCILQDEIAKYVSDPTPPSRLENISEESKVKERREVGEGDETVTIEDTSDEEDGETLQEHFQLRSRFSRPRLPHSPLIDDRPTILEASLLSAKEAAQCGTEARRQEVDVYSDDSSRGEFLE
jgi:hypothetical protein